jgi:GNAT superfamily N-acetyltransferase
VTPIRRATAADVRQMSEVLIASITELCTLDHQDDAQAIAGWVANKSPESIARWVKDPGLLVLVAERRGEVAAVGMLNSSDEIGLNYVSPRHRFAGVSKAMLSALEAEMRQRGATTGRLTSTRTAHDFYLAMGWQDAGALQACMTVTGFPMTKAL